MSIEVRTELTVTETRLGRTGVRVGRLCLGTMIFGSQVAEDSAVAILDHAAELGFDFLDVADVYPVPNTPGTWGQSEEIVGRWLRSRRDRFLLATKFYGKVGSARNDRGGSRHHVLMACEGSLRRLQTDRIDVYYMHRPDVQTPLEETLEALDRLVQDGKVVYVGLSNHSAWHLGLATAICAERRLARVAVVQPRYSLLDRRIERDLLPFCVAEGIAVAPYNPLGAGLLTGKYREDVPPPPDTRFGRGAHGEMYQRRYWSDASFQIVEAVREVAREESMSMAQVALAWMLARPEITTPIIGASKPEQLDDLVEVLGRQLSAESIARLDEVSNVFTADRKE